MFLLNQRDTVKLHNQKVNNSPCIFLFFYLISVCNKPSKGDVYFLNIFNFSDYRILYPILA